MFVASQYSKKDKNLDILDHEDSRASKFCPRERELLIKECRFHKQMMKSIKRVKLFYGSCEKEKEKDFAFAAAQCKLMFIHHMIFTA